MAISIALPHLKSALTTAIVTPLSTLGFQKWCQYSINPMSLLHSILIRVTVFVMYPLVPAVLQQNVRKVENQIAKLERRILQHPKEAYILDKPIGKYKMYLKEILIYFSLDRN